MERKRFYKIDVKGRRLVWEIYVESNKIVVSSYYHNSEKKRTFVREVFTKEQAIKEAEAKIETKIKKDGYIVLQIESAIKKDVLESADNCMSLKTISYNEVWIPDGCFQQPKLDGLRCIASFNFQSQSWTLTSRTRLVYPFLRHIKRDLDLLDCNLIYDGELIHPDGFQILCTLASVQRKSLPPKDLEEHITYNIFDIITAGTQIERFTKLSEYIPINILAKSIRIVEMIEVDDVESIKKVHEIYISKGYEGSVLRSKTNIYEKKLSSFCVKIKDFESTEFKVVNYREGVGLEKGLAIWRCITEEGLEFDCIPKLSDENGSKYLGRMLTVRHQGYDDDHIPRFPRVE